MSNATLGYGYYVVDVMDHSGNATLEDDGERISFPVKDGPYRSEGAALQRGLGPGLEVVRLKVPESQDYV